MALVRLCLLNIWPTLASLLILEHLITTCFGDMHCVLASSTHWHLTYLLCGLYLLLPSSNAPTRKKAHQSPRSCVLFLPLTGYQKSPNPSYLPFPSPILLRPTLRPLTYTTNPHILLLNKPLSAHTATVWASSRPPSHLQACMTWFLDDAQINVGKAV